MLNKLSIVNKLSYKELKKKFPNMQLLLIQYGYSTRHTIHYFINIQQETELYYKSVCNNASVPIKELQATYPFHIIINKLLIDENNSSGRILRKLVCLNCKSIIAGEHGFAYKEDEFYL